MKKNILLKFVLEKNIRPIEADKNQLDQVLSNIIINAKDAMPTGGELILTTENIDVGKKNIKNFPELPQGSYVKISITDTGIGMTKEVREHIFEPFFSTKGDAKGTGLGLATAYGILKNHNGHINVYSEPGEGTTFNLYFPVSDKKIVSMVLKEQDQPREATILVVEDEEDIRSLLKEQLESIGYRVLLADDGRKAVNIFKKNPEEIDLVLLDMIMPNLAGKETNLELRKLKPDVKVLLMSGFSKNGKATEILNQGVLGFIQKPFKLNVLSETIRQVLKKGWGKE